MKVILNGEQGSEARIPVTFEIGTPQQLIRVSYKDEVIFFGYEEFVQLGWLAANLPRVSNAVSQGDSFTFIEKKLTP